VEPVRIDLLTSDPLSVAGIASYLRMRTDLTLVPATGCAEADLRVVSCAGLTADVVAMLRRLAPTGRPVVLITDLISGGEVLTAVECRVVAVLSRAGVTAERLAGVVGAVARAGRAMPPDLVGDLLTQIERVRHDVRSAGRCAPGLTGTELDVLRLTADGHNLAQIAEIISTSPSTVRTTSRRLVDRLEARNRSHAVAYAVRNGLI
jgi:DNA-binding NarL/FixJ family response regulator